MKFIISFSLLLLSLLAGCDSSLVRKDVQAISAKPVPRPEPEPVAAGAVPASANAVESPIPKSSVGVTMANKEPLSGLSMSQSQSSSSTRQIKKVKAGHAVANISDNNDTHSSGPNSRQPASIGTPEVEHTGEAKIKLREELPPPTSAAPFVDNLAAVLNIPKKTAFVSEEVLFTVRLGPEESHLIKDSDKTNGIRYFDGIKARYAKASAQVGGSKHEILSSDNKCHPINLSGTEFNFKVKPIEKGTLTLNAQVQLFNEENCVAVVSELNAKNGFETIKVTVKDDFVEQIKQISEKEAIKIYTAGLGIIGLFLLFLLRKTLKKKFGFSIKEDK